MVPKVNRFHCNILKLNLYAKMHYQRIYRLLITTMLDSLPMPSSVETWLSAVTSVPL